MPDQAEEMPIFKWDTLREAGEDTLRYQRKAVPGKVFEVELTSGPTVTVWRSNDGREYFCHGLTFGGKAAPGGAVSPYGKEVPTILRGHYDPVPESQAKSGDILVIRGVDANDVTHSAVLIVPVAVSDTNYLDYSTKLRSKNGNDPEVDLTLEEIILRYGESYNAYRRK